jgi:membrane associated rhomboid family serine protease
MVDHLCSLPLDDFGLPHLILTTAASAFLHLDFGHLLMNMLLLGVFGVFLEPRLTPGQYLATVLLGSVLSSLIKLNLLVSQADLFDVSSKLFQYPPAGASGAIAGLMGLSVLHCNVIWRSVSRSMRCHALFFFPVFISAAVLIGLFFISDFAGNAIPTHDMTGTADCWGQVGGFLGGLVLGLVFTLIDCDPGERHSDVGKRQDGALEENTDVWYHREMLMSVPEKASTRCYMLPNKLPSREMHRGANATG